MQPHTPTYGRCPPSTPSTSCNPRSPPLATPDGSRWTLELVVPIKLWTLLPAMQASSHDDDDDSWLQHDDDDDDYLRLQHDGDDHELGFQHDNGENDNDDEKNCKNSIMVMITICDCSMMMMMMITARVGRQMENLLLRVHVLSSNLRTGKACMY